MILYSIAEHFMARKQVFQIQHGYLDSTLYLRHWDIVKNTFLTPEGTMKHFRFRLKYNNQGLGKTITASGVLWTDVATPISGLIEEDYGYNKQMDKLS